MNVSAAVATVLALGAVALADPPPPAHPAAASAAAFPKEPACRFKPPASWKLQQDDPFFTVAFEEQRRLVFQGKVQPGGDPATPALLEKYAADAKSSVTRRVPDMKFDIVERKLVHIGGVPAARFVFETTPAGADAKPIRQLQYYLAAGGQHCILTFTAPRESYDEVLSQFESIAQATTIKK